jgi:hypothetical protein
MGYFMSVAECVANGFFLTYFSISLDQVTTHINLQEIVTVLPS